MPIIICETDKKDIIIGNTPHMCAERRFIQYMKYRSKIEGIKPSAFSHWLHRKLGKITISRIRCDGQYGTSIPCIFCRKVLDREFIMWRAHIGGENWVSSMDAVVPASKLTQKQRGILHPNNRFLVGAKTA